MVKASDNTYTEYSFDAWGRRRNPTNWNYDLTGQPELFADRGFTGHEHLTMFNLVNMNGRLYDPLVGRFLSADPYVQMPDYTQSMNRYSYCLNNPLKYTDPSGEEFKWWHIPFLFMGFTGGNYAINDLKGKTDYSFGQAMGHYGVDLASFMISAGVGNSVQELKVFGAIPGALLGGTTQAVTGGLTNGFGNVLLENDWNAFGGGFKQGFITGFISGAVSGGIEGYQNAISTGANPWTGELYSNEITYSATPKSGVSLQPNQERDCYGYSLEYADKGHGNNNASFFLAQTGNAAGADPEIVARSSGVNVNLAGRPTSPGAYDIFGRHLFNGKELIGVISKGGQGHAVNITKMVTADKLRIIGGGFKHVLKSTSIWDPIVGHTNGTTSFLKIISLY